MYILAILIFAFFFYRSSLSYYFVSDDFIALFNHVNNPNLIKIDQLNNHYTPIIWCINFLLYKIFNLNSVPYHIVIILVHLFNCYLVYYLAISFTHSKIKSSISSLLFAFFFGAYEVVYWFGAMNNCLMVTFYLISLLCLMNYVKNRNLLFCLLFQVSFLAAYFTHEYAISLIPVAIAYWWLFSDKKTKRNFLTLLSVPIFVVALTFILKFLFIKMSLVVSTPSLMKFVAFTMRSYVYLFIPNPYFIDKIPNIFIPIIFFFILIFLIKYTKNKQTLFLLIWVTTTIFVYSFTSAPQARYFYLSFIPVIIYTLLVVKIKQLIVALYLSFIFISGLIFLQNQKLSWYKSSEITKKVIGNIKQYYTHPQKDDVLYFVNLPDSSNDSLWKAYVFRAGFPSLLTNILHVFPKKIIFLRSFTPTSHTIEAPYINPEKLKTVARHNIVFVYKEDTGNVFLMK